MVEDWQVHGDKWYSAVGVRVVGVRVVGDRVIASRDVRFVVRSVVSGRGCVVGGNVRLVGCSVVRCSGCVVGSNVRLVRVVVRGSGGVGDAGCVVRCVVGSRGVVCYGSGWGVRGEVM